MTKGSNYLLGIVLSTVLVLGAAGMSLVHGGEDTQPPWPAEAQRLLEEARRLRKEGYVEESDRTYERIIEQCSAERADIACTVLVEQGTWYEGRRNWGRALHFYRQASETAAQAHNEALAPAAKFCVARCLAYQGRSEAAHKLLDGLLDSHPEEAAQLRHIESLVEAKALSDQGKHLEALKLFDEIGEQATRADLRALALYHKARSYFALQKPEEAYGAYEEMVARFPKQDITHWAYRSLGAKYWREKELERALAVYEQEKVSGNGHAARASYNIARVSASLQRTERAMKECQNILTKFPGSQEAFWAVNLLAELYIKDGDDAKAVELWREWSQKDLFPGRQEITLRLAIYYRFQTKEAEKALPLYEQVATEIAEQRTAAPTPLSAHVRGLELTARIEIARIAREHGRVSEALQQLQVCTEELSGLSDTWQAVYEMADCLRETGDLEQAHAVCREFVADQGARLSPDLKQRLMELLQQISKQLEELPK